MVWVCISIYKYIYVQMRVHICICTCLQSVLMWCKFDLYIHMITHVFMYVCIYIAIPPHPISSTFTFLLLVLLRPFSLASAVIADRRYSIAQQVLVFVTLCEIASVRAFALAPARGAHLLSRTLRPQEDKRLPSHTTFYIHIYVVYIHSPSGTPAC